MELRDLISFDDARHVIYLQTGCSTLVKPIKPCVKESNPLTGPIVILLSVVEK